MGEKTDCFGYDSNTAMKRMEDAIVMKSRIHLWHMFWGLAILLLPFCGCDRTIDPSDPQPRKWTLKSVYKAGQLPPQYSSNPSDRISIVFAGDIMPWDRTKEWIEKEGVNYPYLATADLIRSADYAVGNLECPIAVKAKLLDLFFPYKVPPENLAGIVWAGFDLMGLANNHVRDCGEAGVIETLHYLKTAGLSHVGAGVDIEQAQKPFFVEIKGVKIAFIAAIAPDVRYFDYDWGKRNDAMKRAWRYLYTDTAAGKNKAGAAVATPKWLRETIAAAKKEADLVVVFPHWGIRYHKPLSDVQLRFAKIAVDSGADLVVGHHAHIWQATQVYQGKPIIHGLGNFAFGSGNRKADEGLIAKVIIKDKAIEKIEFYPIYTKNRDRKVSYQTKIMKGKFADEMLRRFAELSIQRNAQIRNENGIGVLDQFQTPVKMNPESH